MSVVVAVAQGETVWMGSDSQTTGNVKYVTAPKVWKVGEIIYGIAGTVESCCAIQNLSKLPGSVINARSGGETKDDVDLERWVYHSVLSRVREAISKAEVSEPSFNLLVGLRGRLFVVEENSVFEVMRPYAAIGSAEQIAYGALYVKMNSRGVKLSPKKVVLQAIDACNEHSPDCGKPVVVRS